VLLYIEKDRMKKVAKTIGGEGNGNLGSYLLFSRKKNWKQLASYKMYKRDIHEKRHIR
jgi:hypothetical protein